MWKTHYNTQQYKTAWHNLPIILCYNDICGSQLCNIFLKWWIYSQEDTAMLIGVMHEFQYCCSQCIKHDIFTKELRSISSSKSHIKADVFLQAKQLILYS